MSESNNNHKLNSEVLGKIKFINLHAHTHYSLFDGVGVTAQHVKESLKKGHEGFAMTDLGVMSGIIQLYNMSKDKDQLSKMKLEVPFNTVLGAELYITENLEENRADRRYNQITILIKSEIGYQNLCQLTTIASHEDHFYYRPRIGLDEVIELKEGLIVTCGGYNGIVPQAILNDDPEAEAKFKKHVDAFGKDFIVELNFLDYRMRWDRENKQHVDQGFNPQEKVNQKLIEFAEKYNVKVVIVQNTSMPRKKDHVLQNIMIWNSPMGKDGFHFFEPSYIMSVEEMYELMKKNAPYVTDEQFVEWCGNTMDVLNQCKDCKLTFEPTLPTIKYDENPVHSNPEILKKWDETKELLKKEEPALYDIFVLSESEDQKSLNTTLKLILKYNKAPLENEVYRKRILEEILVIERNGIIGLCDYFLLLEDVTNYVNQIGNLRGFGRGSGAGCLLAYALDITDADPIKYDLLFERFLTKERVGKFDFSHSEISYDEFLKNRGK